MSKETVTIVGAGTIGCSYAAWYASKVHQARIFDVRDNYEAAVRKMPGNHLSEVPGTNVNEAQARDARQRAILEVQKKYPLPSSTSE